MALTLIHMGAGEPLREPEMMFVTFSVGAVRRPIPRLAYHQRSRADSPLSADYTTELDEVDEFDADCSGVCVSSRQPGRSSHQANRPGLSTANLPVAFPSRLYEVANAVRPL